MEIDCEFVSDPDKDVLPGMEGQMCQQVSVLANGILYELQRIAGDYGVEPDDLTHLVRLITSSLEELDMMIGENNSATSERESMATEVENLKRKLQQEQQSRQSVERVRHVFAIA